MILPQVFRLYFLALFVIVGLGPLLRHKFAPYAPYAPLHYKTMVLPPNQQLLVSHSTPP